MTNLTTDLAIVGAGPAGMAAAVAVADAGFDVTVIDEQARAGGQIFRRPPEGWDARHGNYAPYSWARDLIDRFEDHPRIHTLFRATAYGVLRDEGDARLQVAVHGPGGGRIVAARRLLIATGAYDLPVAFPGWTTPGVMTVGAVQSLLKSQKLLAGQRLVLAGSHPILLVAAEQFLKAGAQIAEIAFARGLPRLSELPATVPAIPGHVSVFTQAVRSAAVIASHRVKVSTRTIVTGAVGTEHVTGVTLSRVDDQWRQIPGTTRTAPADTLVLGYGFSPSTELGRQAGCDMVWDSPRGGWVVGHDDKFQTSSPGVFVAGEPTGVSGAEQSWAEGQVAGLSIAESLGGRGAGLADQRTRGERSLRRAEKFSHVVQRMFEPQRDALAELSRPKDTIVCRCELVRSGQVDEVLSDNPFITSANAVKLECRSGMGPCQGRYCEGTVTARVAAARQSSIESAGYFNAHLPIKPVPLNSYRALDGSDDTQAGQPTASD